MTLRALAAASLLAGAAFAAAAQPAPPAVPAQGQDAHGSERKICRVTRTIGTRLGGTRACRTRDEWMQYQRETRQVVERIQSSPSACLAGGRCGG